MIVWLASYPRSGNTLLRTVLKRCMGLDSYADEPIHRESSLREENDLIGHLELPTCWAEFYDEAKRADKLYLVKTHLPPRDNQPYLYVVRDGRAAVQSYLKYYESFLPAEKTSLLKLIVGDDAYGDWSAHFRAWTGREDARGLLLRFEDLINAQPTLLESMAKFLGIEGQVLPWSNPFDALSAIEPDFFRRGEKKFTPTDDWDELSCALFNHLHGGLAKELGYDIWPDVDGLGYSAALQGLVPLIQELLARTRFLQDACDQRMAVINDLKVEADKRLELINRLSESNG